MLPQVPEARERHHPQLDPGAVVGHRGDAGLAARRHLGHPLLIHERLDRRYPVGDGGDQVDVLGGLAEAAQAAGDLAAFDRPAGQQLGPRALGQRQQARDRGAPALRPFRRRQPLQDRRLGLDAEPRERPHPLLERRLANVADGLEVELGEDPLGRLWPDSLDPHHRHRPGRVSPLEPRQRRDLAGLDQLGHLLGDGVADTGQGRQLALQRQPLDRLGRLVQGLGRAPVGEHAVDDRALEFEQIGHQVEAVGDVSVGEGLRHGG